MIKKKNILIIGGSGLIGSSICKFLNKKYSAYINIINLDKINRHDKNIFFYNCDLSKNKKNFDLLLKRISKKHGNIDSLVNCSFPQLKKKNENPLKINTQIFVGNYSLHLKSYLNVIIGGINYFLRNKIKGNIISFASIYGSSTPIFEIYNKKILTSLEYNFIKNNIIHATKYYAKLIRGSGIKINCVSPGGVFDNQNKKFVKNYSKNTNNNEMLGSNDLTSLIKFLILENKKISGQDLIIDDGFTL